MSRRRCYGLFALPLLLACVGEEGTGPRPVPSALEVTAGAAQTGVVAQPLDSAVRVRVRDQHGNPMAGVLVLFTGPATGGSLSPGVSTTGPDGEASSSWTLPTTIGQHTGYARLAEGDSVAFTATAIPDKPAALVVVSGDSQSTLARSRLPADVVVRVDDQFGNPVAGRYLQFAPVSGEGSVQFANVPTLTGGLATTRWTLGDSAGPMRLLATIDTIPAETLFATARFVAPPAMDLAMGPEHGCAIDVTGALQCWAVNRAGEVSPGYQVEYSPVAAGYGLSVKAVAAGFNHTCTIAQDDQTRCWGQDGLLGSSTPFTGAAPILVEGNHAFASIASGTFHACGLEADGAAWCWGWNSRGELGNGVPSPVEYAPVRVNTAAVFVAVTGGYYFTCALTRYGEAWCWGSNDLGQLGGGNGPDASVPAPVPTALRFETLEAGTDHVCGIAVGGTGHCWGSNTGGKLGGGSNSVQPPIVPVTGGRRFTAIAAGGEHSCGVDTSGVLLCWGGNVHGAVGGGAPDFNFSPVSVGPVPMLRPVLGEWSSCSRGVAGTIYCWGDNRVGQTGLGPTGFRTTPVAVLGGRSFLRLTSGSTHTCAQEAQQATYCWGSNFGGEGGRNSPTGASVPMPALASETLLQVETGYLHTCGVVQGIGAACWGLGPYLGTGSPYSFLSAPVPLSGGTGWQAVVTSEEESCGLQADSTAVCWGWQSVPVQTPGAIRYAALTAGGDMMCGLTAADGSVPAGQAYCWTSPGQTPTLVATGLVSIAAGQQSACGLQGDGTALCWTQGMVASPVSTPLKFAALDKGAGFHTCGIATDGKAYCWGYSWYGGLGDGTFSAVESTTPAPVQTNLLFSTISVGGHHTCGITTTGGTLCWGLNSDGQLGNGESATVSAPRLVF